LVNFLAVAAAGAARAMLTFAPRQEALLGMLAVAPARSKLDI